MKAHLINTYLLVPGSRLSAKVKVKYQGHVSQKIGVLGGISVSQTHLVLFIDIEKLVEVHIAIILPRCQFCARIRNNQHKIFQITK